MQVGSSACSFEKLVPVLSQVLYDFVLSLIHKNRVRKICFQRGFEFFKTISFIKKNVEGASKNEIG